MFARSTKIPGQPELVDDGVEFIRHTVWPSVREMPGFVGLSLLVDRTAGLCIATTAWENEDDMHATEQGVRPLREGGAKAFGGDYAVEEWEVAMLHRDHRSKEGACVRATWLQLSPTDVDRGIDVVKLVSMPKMEELQGFCSASLLVNRSTRRACLSATYDSIEAMEVAREQASAIRDEGTKELGAEIIEVAEFELVMAHLDVPELV